MTRPTRRSLSLVALAASFAGWGLCVRADATYDGVKFYDCLTTGTSQYGGQRVNTGYCPNGRTIIRAKYAPNNVSSANQALFCSRKSTSLSEANPNFTYFAVVSKKPRFDYNATQHWFNGGKVPTVGDIYFLEIKNGYATVSNEDGSVFDYGGASAVVDFTSPNALFLFTTYSHDTSTDTYSSFGNGAQVDFYYLKIYEIEDGEEVLKHAYVPCKTAAGVIAIADKVTETVLYNGASSQTFTIPDWCEDAYWKDEGTDKRVLTVRKNASYAITSADASTLVSSGRQLVIRGGGTVRSPGALTRFGKDIVVEDGTSIEMISPVAVTGSVSVADGTLRVPETQDTYVGNAGLMGYVAYPDSKVWWFDMPSATAIARDYTNFYPHGTDLLTEKSTCITTYHLHGYIWNRSTTNETWSFWANFNDRSFVWMDNQVVFSNVASYDEDGKRCKTVTDITPGSHEIILNFSANSAGVGPEWWSSAVGCCGIALDKCGRGMTSDVTSYYEPLVDPGDGSLLTVDNSATALGTYWVPAFANVSFGTNGVFDCGGHALTVGTLAGFGTVTNAATLTVAGKFILKVSDAAHAPLAVDGTLAFADGAVADFDSYAEPGAEQKAALDEGIVVARATAITGRPTLQSWLKSAGYRLRKRGNTLVLMSAKSFALIVR